MSNEHVTRIIGALVGPPALREAYMTLPEFRHVVDMLAAAAPAVLNSTAEVARRNEANRAAAQQALERNDSPTVWHVAVCQQCEPVLPQPFRSSKERDVWAFEHSTATGHTIATEVQHEVP